MGRIVIGLWWGLAFSTALYPQTRLAQPNDPAAAAQSGQSEIIINAAAVEKDLVIWVNDTITAHVFPKTTEKIIVPDGRNIIHAAETTLRSGRWNIGDKKQLIVDSSSNRVTVQFLMRYGRLISMRVEQNISLQPSGQGGGPQSARTAPQPAGALQRLQELFSPAASPPPARTAAAPPAASGGSPIEGAVYRAAEVLVTDLPDGETLAILSMAAADSEMADFVIEELAYLMVETRKFKVVDRQSLDAIMVEQNFQYSGDVDDKSAVSIGKLLGAGIVITGSISGSGSTRRLRTKALDVRTAEILAMASERF
jgi:TolB-like protein